MYESLMRARSRTVTMTTSGVSGGDRPGEEESRRVRR